MTYKLPDLEYDYNALEPYIDETTMKIHHGKHHAGYVSKLNAVLEGKTQLEGKTVEELLSDVETLDESIKQNVINNGGGHANHSLFWKTMGVGGNGKPEGELGKVIETTFGSFDSFKEKFTEKALGLFGSGWAFLQVDGNKLELKRHSFQNSPLMYGKTPILGLDVWEHAYYLKYQNKRDEYIKAWWNVVNWKEVENNFLQAKK